MRRWRKKIEPDPRAPHFTITEPGVGYRFRDEPGLAGGGDARTDGGPRPMFWSSTISRSQTSGTMACWCESARLH